MTAVPGHLTAGAAPVSVSPVSLCRCLRWWFQGAGRRPAGCERKRALFVMQRRVLRAGKPLHRACRRAPGVPSKDKFYPVDDTGVRSAAFLASDCTIGALWRRHKPLCITLFAGQSASDLQIGDFSGFVEASSEVCGALHGVPRVSGQGMDGALRNRAGKPMVVHARTG